MNPLRADPTRTTLLRNRFAAAVGGRFDRFSVAVGRLVGDADVFGLRPTDFTANTRWKFETNERKLALFRLWIQDQVSQGILRLEPGHTGRPWTADYIYAAYRKGTERAYDDANRGKRRTADERDAFLRERLNGPVAVERLRLLFTRNFESLRGVTEQMSAQMSRVLADGLAAGRGPKEVARQLQREVGLSKSRATTIARTELIHSYAEGQLDSFEKLGVTEVGALVEWETAGDNRVCPKCSALNGAVFKIKQARGLIPRHPRCRCSWSPVIDGESYSAPKLSKAIERSVRAERPKAPLAEARKRSKWAAAGKRFAGR